MIAANSPTFAGVYRVAPEALPQVMDSLMPNGSQQLASGVPNEEAMVVLNDWLAKRFPPATPTPAMQAVLDGKSDGVTLTQADEESLRINAVATAVANHWDPAELTGVFIYTRV